MEVTIGDSNEQNVFETSLNWGRLCSVPIITKCQFLDLFLSVLTFPFIRDNQYFMSLFCNKLSYVYLSRGTHIAFVDIKLHTNISG